MKFEDYEALVHAMTVSNYCNLIGDDCQGCVFAQPIDKGIRCIIKCYHPMNWAREVSKVLEKR